MKKNILLIICLCITMMMQAIVSKSVFITAGGLSAALSYTEKATVTNLTVKGTMNAIDFKTMRDDCTVLDVIDLSQVTINGCTGIGTQSSWNNITYPANAVPINAFGTPDYSTGGSGNKIKSITFPSSLNEIGSDAFYSCNQLTSIAIPSSVTKIGSNAFQYCTGLTSATTPFGIDSNGNSLFDGCNLLKTITIPDGLTTIKTNAFMKFDQITTFNIPSSVTNIGYGAFQLCYGFKSIALPSSIVTIGDGAFWYCTGLTSITIPTSVNSIGVTAFKGCIGLTGSLIIPTSVKSIGISAFQECAGLSGSLVIPSSVTSIGDHAFSKCSGFTSVSLSPSMTSIESYTFESCTGLSGSLIIPSSVTSIAQAAFWECSGLTSVTIPNSVTTIGDGAFGLCSKLTSATIPPSVTSIGNSAFSDCSSLSSIYSYKSTPVDLSSSLTVFSNVNKTTCKLYVPFGTKAIYQLANQWKDFINIEEMSSTCTLPTTKATSLTSTAITNNSMTVGWSRGNGNAVLVVAKAGSAVNANPADGTSYTASNVFGSGTQIGSGNYVVYNGTGSSVNLTSLTKGTTYYYAIYEYNTAANCYMTTALLGNATTTNLTSTVVIDFETLGQNWSWLVFENWDNDPAYYSVVSNPNPTGINTSAHVARYIVNSSGQPWAGLWSTDYGNIVLTKDNCMIKIMVYKSVKTNFDLKLENGSYNYEKQVSNTKLNQWEELTFDFSSQIGQTFKMLTIIPDFPSVRTGGSINYWDNISFNSTSGSGFNQLVSDNIRIYPNPTTGKFEISGIADLGNDCRIEIINQLGIQIFITQNENFENKMNLDLSDFPAGIYIVSLSNNGVSYQKKIIKK